ncbi:protein bicaudal C homolog 1-A-like [Juglans microcarpa x Juglans regia]|uniref:protein bicaudal C homolog 1-A-like n=1 Tax=Juglans microcarpa x Juglans regia TaxID=2249226 RepID=UPI001B7EE3E0|nr:protein bicaudal C homolog 1-A-like [Juglans microcarpa x Juglans regia]
MAAELQPPEALMTAGPTAASASATTTTALEATTAVLSTDNLGQALAPKRQRRPSVRLGEIGDQPATLSYESHVRRNKQHPWRLPKEHSSKSVKARLLTNLVNGGDYHDIQEPPEDRNQNGDGNLEFANRKKAKRGATKRARSNWVTRIEDGAVAEGDSREDGNQNEGFRDFDPDSDSQQKDHSPVHSVDKVELDLWHGFRRQGRARASESRENDAVELDNFPESDSRDRKCVTSEGVRSWLFELGLSRYAPVFEIHEVDDDVLPMLTLEDLKDMGINAIGSRRKMYSAIQKLRKGFS